MSLALSMKSLVEDIKSSRSDRHAWVKDLDTKQGINRKIWQRIERNGC